MVMAKASSLDGTGGGDAQSFGLQHRRADGARRRYRRRPLGHVTDERDRDHGEDEGVRVDEVSQRLDVALERQRGAADVVRDKDLWRDDLHGARCYQKRAVLRDPAWYR